MLTLAARNLCSQAAPELMAILHLSHPSAGITAICYHTWLNALPCHIQSPYKLMVLMGSRDKPHLVSKQLQWGLEGKSAKANDHTAHEERSDFSSCPRTYTCTLAHVHMYAYTHTN